MQVKTNAKSRVFARTAARIEPRVLTPDECEQVAGAEGATDDKGNTYEILWTTYTDSSGNGYRMNDGQRIVDQIT